IDRTGIKQNLFDRTAVAIILLFFFSRRLFLVPGPSDKKEAAGEIGGGASSHARVSSFLGLTWPYCISVAHFPASSSVLRAASISFAQVFQASLPCKNSATVSSLVMASLNPFVLKPAAIMVRFEVACHANRHIRCERPLQSRCT